MTFEICLTPHLLFCHEQGTHLSRALLQDHLTKVDHLLLQEQVPQIHTHTVAEAAVVGRLLCHPHTITTRRHRVNRRLDLNVTAVVLETTVRTPVDLVETTEVVVELLQVLKAVFLAKVCLTWTAKIPERQTKSPAGPSLYATSTTALTPT